MRKRVLPFAVVLLLLGPPAGVCPGWADQPGTAIKGLVLLDGEPPTPQEWKLDEAMQRVTSEKVFREETWLVGKNNGLAHCLVTLKAKNPADQVATKPLEKTILDKVGVRYV